MLNVTLAFPLFHVTAPAVIFPVVKFPVLIVLTAVLSPFSFFATIFTSYTFLSCNPVIIISFPVISFSADHVSVLPALMSHHYNFVTKLLTNKIDYSKNP